MSLGGSYFVRLTSNDRTSGTLNRFQVDASSHPQLQNITAARVHTVSFPNVHPNIWTSNNVIGVAQTTGGGDPIHYTTEDIPAGTTFRAAVIPFGGGIWRSVTFPFTIPANSSIANLSAVITAEMGGDPGFSLANAICYLDPFLPRFGVTYDPGFNIQIDAIGGPNACDPVLYRQLGIPVTGTIGVVGVPYDFNVLSPQVALPYLLIEIPTGQYTAADFGTAVALAINTAIPTALLTIVLEDEFFNPRYRFTSAVGLSYFSTLDSNGLSTASRPLGISDSSIGYVTDFLATSTPNLRGLVVVSLQSQTLSMSRCVQARENEYNEQSRSISTVTEIPVDVEFGGWVNYQPPIDQPIYYSGSKNLSSLAFSLRDPLSRGEPIQLCEPGLHLLLEVIAS